MNLDLSEELNKAFPDIVPVVRPLVKNKKIKDQHWLAGFTSAEGRFMIKINKSRSTKLGEAVHL